MYGQATRGHVALYFRIKISIKKEPGVQKVTKKRSFSVALLEPKPDIAQKEEEEKEDISLFKDPTLEALLDPVKDKDDQADFIANHTRKRHALQQEDIECSAEFGIPI
jgi:hypothetical protein